MAFLVAFLVTVVVLAAVMIGVAWSLSDYSTDVYEAPVLRSSYQPLGSHGFCEHNDCLTCAAKSRINASPAI